MWALRVVAFEFGFAGWFLVVGCGFAGLFRLGWCDIVALGFGVFLVLNFTDWFLC